MESVPKARWYRIGLLLFMIYLVAFIDRSNIGMAAPLMVKSLGLSSTVVGVLLSAFFWGYVLTQIPGGWVAGKFSAKQVIIWALIVWGIAAILTGVVHSLTGLLFVRFLMGLSEGLVWPAFSMFFVNWYPDHERARAVNFSEMSLPISSIIMAPLAGWMIAQWNYQMMFILQGIPPFIMAILFALYASDTPAKDRMLSKEERDYLEQNKSSVMKEKGSLKEVLTNPKIWVFSVIYFLWITGMYSFGLWMPSLMKQLSKSGILTVGWLTAVPFVLAAICMYLNATWSDRRGGNRTFFVAIPLLIGGLALVVERFIGVNLIINLIILIIAGIGIYSAFGPWWAWAMSFVPRNQAGSANGLINLCGNFGGIVGPIVVGAVAQDGNLVNGFYILGFSLIAGSLLSIFVAGKFRVLHHGMGESLPNQDVQMSR
jgi:sugar phosphate permease